MKRTVLILLAAAIVVMPAYALRRSSGDDLVTALFKQAKSLMADEDYDGALKKLKRIVADYPEHDMAEAALATINHCYQTIGYMDEAYDYFNEVRKKHRDLHVATVASYHAVPILIHRGSYDEALIRCNEIIAADGKSYWAIGALFTMAKLYCDRMDRLDEGRKMYKKIKKKFPNTQFARIASMELKMLDNR